MLTAFSVLNMQNIFYAEYGATLQTIVLLHDGNAPAREMQSIGGNARIITLK